MRNGALGFVGASQDLPAFTKGGSTLLVFALPEDVAQAASVDEGDAVTDNDAGRAGNASTQ